MKHIPVSSSYNLPKKIYGLTNWPDSSSIDHFSEILKYMNAKIKNVVLLLVLEREE